MSVTVRRNSRGEYFSHCRRCKIDGLPHYTRHSALQDAAIHLCPELYPSSKRSPDDGGDVTLPTPTA